MMKTLTLHIEDTIYDEVKNFLALFPPQKIKIEENSTIKSQIQQNALVSEENIANNELTSIDELEKEIEKW